MRGFKRKLSVIVALAMILALLPGAGAREIAARAAETLEQIEPPAKMYETLPYGTAEQTYYKGGTGIMWIAAEFPTATAANAWRNEKIEKNYEGIEIGTDTPASEDARIDIMGMYFSGTEGYRFDGEDPSEISEVIDYDPNADVFKDILRFAFRIGPNAPDEMTFKVTADGQEFSLAPIQIEPAPVVTDIQIASSVDIPLGNQKAVPFTVDNPEAPESGLLRVDCDDEKVSVGWTIASTYVLNIVPLKEEPSVITLWFEGSDVKAEISVNVTPREMILDREELTLTVQDNGKNEDEIELVDIGCEDIMANGGWDELADLSGEDNGIVGLYMKYTPEWTIDNPEIAELEPRTDNGWQKKFAFVRARKPGVTTIRVTMLGVTKTCKLTVTEDEVSQGDTLEDKMLQVLNETIFNGSEDESWSEMVEAVKTAVERLSELCEGQTLTETQWGVLRKLSNHIWYNDNNASSEDTLGIFVDADNFAASITPPEAEEDMESVRTFWVNLTEASSAVLNAAAGTGKVGFEMSFAESYYWEEEKTPITALKLPIRVKLKVPESLRSVSDLRFYSVRDGSAAQMDYTRDGDYVYVQINAPGAFVFAGPETTSSGGSSGGSSSGGSSSGGSSGSSGSSSNTPAAPSAPAPEAPAVTVKPSASTEDTASGDWVEDENGWQFKKEDGSYSANTWEQLTVDGQTDWYYFGEDGYMETGWVQDGDDWYYLSPESDGTKGHMVTGWVQDGDDWYYLSPDADDGKGQMATGWVQDGDDWYYLSPESDGKKGHMKTGWVQDGDEWYYLNPVSDGTKGQMATGWVQDGDDWYYLSPESDGKKGHMKTGWLQDGDEWYYLDPESDGRKGHMLTGWQPIGGVWYYFDEASGHMLANTTTPDGYRVDANGAWIQ